LLIHSASELKAISEKAIKTKAYENDILKSCEVTTVTAKQLAEQGETEAKVILVNEEKWISRNYLNDVVKELKHRGYKRIRWSDDTEVAIITWM